MRKIIPLSILFFFSCFLMFHTFSYDVQRGEMLLASRVWSDFGAHIPLIRSFSLGENWPPEYPIFPGEKIRYHFLFYFLVGVLERIGFRIDIALNFLSSLGFFALLIFIYKVALLLFERRSVAYLSILFFLFNGSLSFLTFFQKHPIHRFFLWDIVGANQFPTFGPWDGGLVTAFTHLNVYTNQRHVAAAFAIVLAILYTLLMLTPKRPRQHSTTLHFLPGFLVGILMSSLLFLNQAGLLIAVIFLGFLFLAKPQTRIPLLVAAIVTFPFLWYFFHIAQPGGQPLFELGYLSPKPFAIKSFALFWFHNLGLHSFFIPLGVVLAPKRIRLFFLPLLILFIIPNVYRFSPDMINNHKFFNFFTIVGGMYTAHALVTLHRFLKKIPFLSFCLLSSVICLLTFSGVIDFFVVKNDYYLVLPDIPKNADAAYIAANTPKDAIILNSTWFYHPASLAGRKVYNGYSFFTWSAGYDAYGREATVKQIFQSDDISFICSILYREHISFVELNKHPEPFLEPIDPYWESRIPVYENTQTGVRLYDRTTICP